MTSTPIRLMSDHRELERNGPPGVSAGPHANDICKWDATILGPDETPWEGGCFPLKLVFPRDYPERPPRVRFTCRMFHPNIYPDGSICLDILGQQWSPIYTVSTILSSIQSLLTDPNPDSPANVEACRLYKEDQKAYKRKVRAVAEESVN
uniref:UBC core domain-containing protein n=1 Tax=Palpitomonas bilix TaxID=652834 RepID=A0A7S3DLI0_9EUKA|mmetsp:Transcript_42770/g.110282  ORF Transcript_42770/g.110282 Transcript_42770/m.110282 type:complete len:150 (+) Transcript_42770:175-624(+)